MSQTQLDFIKRRLPTVEYFSDHVLSDLFFVREDDKATLSRTGADMRWLVDEVDHVNAACARVGEWFVAPHSDGSSDLGLYHDRCSPEDALHRFDVANIGAVFDCIAAHQCDARQ